MPASGRDDWNGLSAWLLGLVSSGVVRFVLFAPGCSSGCSATDGRCRDEGGFNLVGRHCDMPAVYGDPHRFSCAVQDLVRATVGRFQGAPYCILPDKDMGRVCQVLVGKDRHGDVTCRWDWPGLLEVASELGNELRWIPGVGRVCQKFAWNTVVPRRRLQVFFKGRAYSEEEEGDSFSPTLLRSAH